MNSEKDEEKQIEIERGESKRGRERKKSNRERE